MKVPQKIEKTSDMDSSYFEDLIRLLNVNHTVELVGSDKYLFQALYSQIFNQMKERPIPTDSAKFSNQVQKVFFSELNRINERYQNRLEIIMSNSEIRNQIIDFLSRQVYQHLSKSTSV